MKENFKLIKRKIIKILPEISERKIVLITGARQTGKTTLAKNLYKSLKYINLDAPENREILREISTFNWSRDVGNAIIDEAQKEPSIFEKVKYSFDNNSINFTVILGSSQILLIKRIREILTGRIWIYELFPFLMSELNNNYEDTIFEKIIKNKKKIDDILEFEPKILFEKDNIYKNTENLILQYGSMPPIIHFTNDEERKEWLKDYTYTYLERDLSDLVRLNDLMPFLKLQQLSALRCSKLLNYSEIARDCSISTDTAKRYIEYLKISYHAFLLYPYYKNITSSLIKTPKIYWIDTGILRSVISNWSNLITGEIFENMIVSEVYKLIKTMHLDTKIYFYRTRTGMEIDLLLEIEGKLIGIEIKNRKNIIRKDYKNLKIIGEKVGDNWLGGIVLYRGNMMKKIDKNLWIIPSYRFFN